MGYLSFEGNSGNLYSRGKITPPTRRRPCTTTQWIEKRALNLSIRTSVSKYLLQSGSRGAQQRIRLGDLDLDLDQDQDRGPGIGDRGSGTRLILWGVGWGVRGERGKGKMFLFFFFLEKKILEKMV